MPPKATSVAEYLKELPEDRRSAIESLRQTILASLDEGYEEGVQYGMIGYYVPHRVFPAGYHCDPKQPLPFASIASQKNHMAFYCMGVYMDAELAAWFEGAWKKTGKKLDMGKCCVRFKKIEDVPLDVVGEVIRRMPAARYIARYEANLGGQKSRSKAGGAAKADAPAKERVKKATAGTKSATKSPATKIPATKSPAKKITKKAAAKATTKKAAKKPAR